MGIEAGKYKEKDIPSHEATEYEEKYKKENIEKQKNKEYKNSNILTEKKLNYLHELVDKGVLTQKQAKNIDKGENLNQKEIQEIFDKIDEIEDVKSIDNYLPDNLRINKGDYLKAMNDDVFRIKIITKLETALTLIAKQIMPDSSYSMNLFSGFLSVLDKNLILIQENNISIKNNLKKVHESKFPKQKNSFFSFIKKLFK